MTITTGPVYGQYNTEQHFHGERPVDHLDMARRCLASGQWARAVQSYVEYSAHEPAPEGDVLVEHALALLAGKRPRACRDDVQDDIHGLLERARERFPECVSAEVLSAIVNEDIDHAFQIADETDNVHSLMVAALDLEWARRIVSSISVRESRTWQALHERVHPGSGSQTQVRSPLSEEEQQEREHRMGTLFRPVPVKPGAPTPLTLQPGVFTVLVGFCSPLFSLWALGDAEASWWRWYSPLPYVVLISVALVVTGSARTGLVLIVNRRQRMRFRSDIADHERRMKEYHEALPTQTQVEGWVRQDVDFIKDRALTRLGMVLDELSERGRIHEPLVIVGPAKPKITKIARHPAGGYFASHYSVFIMCMTDRKLGAYSTILNAITGVWGPEEQTSEYRYQDIVSVGVRTVRLADPRTREAGKVKEKDGDPAEQDADTAYTFVDARPEVALAERFTLVVPGDRFVVTTRVSSEKGKRGPQLAFSQADRALAAIRRRIHNAGLVASS